MVVWRNRAGGEPPPEDHPTEPLEVQEDRSKSLATQMDNLEQMFQQLDETEMDKSVQMPTKVHHRFLVVVGVPCGFVPLLQ